MRFFYRYKWKLLSILVIANVWIYCKRENGFEYTKYSTISELYPLNPTIQFNKKWTAFNSNRFTAKEIREALTILKDSLDIGKVLNEEDKICAIGSWLFKLFRYQRGAPQPFTFELSVPQCYHLFNSKKQLKLWCGHFQDMFALFCTAAGLPNRYVEIVPLNNQVESGFHEVNEVYLSAKKKWVMVDVSRNIILLRGKGVIISAAEYYDSQTKNEKALLTFVCNTDQITQSDNYLQNNPNDIYFDKNHFLRYYYTKDLTKVYTVKSKILRYFLPKPWYENYAPLRRHSNILFRVKQIIGGFTLFFACMVLYQFLAEKNKTRFT